MSAAVEGFLVGRCQIIIAVKGCKGCGVEFSERWFEQKIPIIINGKRNLMSVPICANCAPHHREKSKAAEETLARAAAEVIQEPVEVGHL